MRKLREKGYSVNLIFSEVPKKRKPNKRSCPIFRTLRFSQRTKHHLTFFTVLIMLLSMKYVYHSPIVLLSLHFLFNSDQIRSILEPNPHFSKACPTHLWYKYLKSFYAEN